MNLPMTVRRRVARWERWPIGAIRGRIRGQLVAVWAIASNVNGLGMVYGGGKSANIGRQHRQSLAHSNAPAVVSRCMYGPRVPGTRYRPPAGPPLHPYLFRPGRPVQFSRVKHGPIGGHLDRATQEAVRRTASPATQPPWHSSWRPGRDALRARARVTYYYRARSDAIANQLACVSCHCAMG